MHNLKNRKPLKILFVGAESAPFAKVGGLGEVMHALPISMRELGHDARVIIPKYASISQEKFPMELEMDNLHISASEDPHGLLVSNILKHTAEDNSITYFLENMEYFEKRANVYGYIDDTTRWVLLSRATLEFIKRSAWKPDFIIASDWEAGFIPNLLKTEYKDCPELKDIRVIFCIHNLRNQGTFDAAFIPEIEADSGQSPLPPFFSNMRTLNGMRRGILYADATITVSPTYSKEILSPEYGERLDGLLKERRERLFGILNGINIKLFNPATDTLLVERYSSKNIAPRRANKLALQHHFGLTENEHTMVFGFVGRLDEQKGLYLIQESIKPLLDNLDFQFVIMGTGERAYKKFFKELAELYPGRVGVHLEYSDTIPRKIFAGADVVLVPSRFEPSGLVQMEAMRYGAIPLVRKTGGLADTVNDYDPNNNEGTGFVFEKYDPQSLLVTMVRAYEGYRNKKEWLKLIKRAMNEDFSWEHSAQQYLSLCYKIKRDHKKK